MTVAGEEFDVVIKNGIVATASDVGMYDIGIKDGKIARLGLDLVVGSANVIDAEGAYVTPGGIDAHCHLDEPPMFPECYCTDDYESGSRSAVAGGTTCFINFAMQLKNMPSIIDVVERAQKSSKNSSYCDYAHHLIMTLSNKHILNVELPELVEKYGITSVKLFMTYDTMKLSDRDLLNTFSTTRRLGITTMVHAESNDIIDYLTEQLEAKDLTSPFYHSTARPTIAEEEATNRAMCLARVTDTPVLFVHVSAPRAFDAIREAQGQSLPFFAETCPQYLFLKASDLDTPDYSGSKLVCSPPPRVNLEDLEAVWKAIANGTVTIFSSDHCSFNYNGDNGKQRGFCLHDSNRPLGTFSHIPNGMPGVETRVPLLFNYGVLGGIISIRKFVEVTATNPARLYGMYPKKGTLLPGLSDADLTIWYPEGKMSPFKLTNDRLHHNVDYTPFEGYNFVNWPRYTLVRGQIVYAEGKIIGKKGFGQYIKREKSEMAIPKKQYILSEWNPDMK